MRRVRHFADLLAEAAAPRARVHQTIGEGLAAPCRRESVLVLAASGRLHCRDDPRQSRWIAFSRNAYATTPREEYFHAGILVRDRARRRSRDLYKPQRRHARGARWLLIRHLARGRRGARAETQLPSPVLQRRRLQASASRVGFSALSTLLPAKNMLAPLISSHAFGSVHGP